MSHLPDPPPNGRSASHHGAVQWALLDVDGVIVAVNDAWRAFADENGGDSRRAGVGMSYLDVCDEAGDEVSAQIAAGIRSAIAGDLPAPLVVRFPCDAQAYPRAFDVLLSSRFDDGGRCVGATVTLSQVADDGTAVDQLSETKVNPPQIREDWLDRPRLVEWMDTHGQLPVLLIAAPAGYGKSTLVTQWVASGHAGPVAWVQLEPADNDPTRLWSHLAAALERIGCPVGVNIGEYVAMSATAITTRLVPRVIEALVSVAGPLTIVLEDLHLMRSAECGDQLSLLIENLPANAHLVLVSRSDPQLRLGRLRVEGRLAEIRTGELSFTAEESELLLTRQGVVLSGSALAELVRLTEGWPAALHLAALSLQGRTDAHDFVARLSGSNRFIADYLSEEVLSRQDPELRRFILQMSAFDRFDAALADHVTRTRSSARLLQELERRNLFLIPLHGGGWFRFHHLFGTFARSALEIQYPEQLPELHLRGAEWFAAHDDVEEAVHHTMAAEDFIGAASLVQKNWLRFFDAGRSATVTAWLRRLRWTPADSGAAATVTGAWMAALTGDRAELQRRETALDTMAEDGPLPDGTKSTRSALLLIRGLFGYAGPDRMLADARRAVELETDTSTPWHAVACAALGHAAFVTGDVPLARARLGEAARSPVAALTVRMLALGTLSLLEAEHGNLALSARLADEAMDIVTTHCMEGMPQVVMAATARGASLALSGRFAEARTTLDEGLRARRRFPGLSPWPLIHHLTVMAAVAARTGDSELAEELLAEVEELAPWADESMTLTRSRIANVKHWLARRPAEPARIDTARTEPARIHTARTPARIGNPLTPRELEILRRLRGTQTLREIASDLYVSHNTVKTLTLSVYRKLGVHSRSEVLAITDGAPQP